MTENEIKKTIEIERELKAERIGKYSRICKDMNILDLVERLLINAIESSES